VRYVEAMVRGYREGEIRDVREDINNTALEIVGKTLFDADMTRDANVVFGAMHDLTEMLVEHINLPLPVPRWWPSRGNRRKIAAIEAIEAIMWRLLATRQLDGKDHGDLLSAIAFARDASGVALTKHEMRDNLMTLIFAGHETTAHSATWAWYLLAKHPEKAETLHAEIARVVGTRPLEARDLDALPYLTAVVKESLRMMPAVWAYMRAPTEEVTIEGYTFPKQCHIFISPLVLGRDARNHPNPMAFEPERWTRVYERGLRKGAYVPFAAGPRVCLGQGFAQMEMKLLLGTMIQNLVPKLAPGFEPDIVPELSMHPGRRGMQIEVAFRDDARLRTA
jgi:cytochrome P450